MAEIAEEIARAVMDEEQHDRHRRCAPASASRRRQRQIAIRQLRVAEQQQRAANGSLAAPPLPTASKARGRSGPSNAVQPVGGWR